MIQGRHYWTRSEETTPLAWVCCVTLGHYLAVSDPQHFFWLEMSDKDPFREGPIWEGCPCPQAPKTSPSSRGSPRTKSLGLVGFPWPPFLSRDDSFSISFFFTLLGDFEDLQKVEKLLLK